MGVSEETVLTITCDNPNCPGNELDPTSRTGWTFVSHEVYGKPGQQNVYCCSMCAGTVVDVLAEGEAPMPMVEANESTVGEEHESE